MKRVADRDVDAFEQIYDRHHGLVYGIAVRMLHEPAAAQDVLQAVFATVWSRPQTFRGGHFAAWLGRVTRNRCLDELRAATHQVRDLRLIENDEDDAEAAAFAHLDAEVVYGALAALPPEQRDAIELAYFEGLTQREIACRTATPLGTIKSRIRTGLLALRRSLIGTRS